MLMLNLEAGGLSQIYDYNCFLAVEANFYEENQINLY